MANRIYPVVPSVPDERDFKYCSLKLPEGRSRWARLKAKVGTEVVDLRPYCPPIKNQLDLGACTGFCYTGYRELMLRRFYQFEWSTQNIILSPMYIYFRERQDEGTILEDSGAQMRTGCRVLVEWGVCPEDLNPYKPSLYTRPPDAEDDEAAKALKMSAFHRLDNIEEWKDCLRRHHPIAIGMAVYSGMDTMTDSGMLTLPRSGEECEGGHAVLVVGFDEKRRVFIVRNSWDVTWGDKGYFYMPYEYAANSEWVFDAWMLTLGNEMGVI